MRNCPNCGAPLEPYKCKCEYCGTWYFDFTAFDMSENVPYYVKFRTTYGVITTLARPELQTIEFNSDNLYAENAAGNICTITRSYSCDLNVVFHSQVNPEDGSLYKIDINSNK